MIDAEMIAKILATLMGCWALGYGIGTSMKWVDRLRDVA